MLETTYYLAIDCIRLDFQPAECLIEETVQLYIEHLRRGDDVPPLRVRYDGANYFLEDGFHRLEAARRLGQKKIRAEVLPGTLQDMEADFRRFLDALKTDLRKDARHR